MPDLLKRAAEASPKHEKYKVWQEGYFPKECFNAKVLMQKLNYLHLNPVKEGWVREPADYVYSSAIDYAGGKGMLELVLM